MKYNIGDIVFVKRYKYENGTDGENHAFVIIDEDNNAIDFNYFGFIVSSQTQKSNKKSNYKYNEEILKSKTNNLKQDSIVKCDNLFEINSKNVAFKIGTVDIDDFIKFINLYNEYLQDNE